MHHYLPTYSYSNEPMLIPTEETNSNNVPQPVTWTLCLGLKVKQFHSIASQDVNSSFCFQITIYYLNTIK